MQELLDELLWPLLCCMSARWC